MAGWIQWWSTAHETWYFHNEESDETTWTRPTGVIISCSGSEQNPVEARSREEEVAAMMGEDRREPLPRDPLWIYEAIEIVASRCDELTVTSLVCELEAYAKL